MSQKKIKVVLVKKSGKLQQSILPVSTNFDISKTTFIYEFDGFKIAIYGKTGNDGIAGQENKYEFPPPFDKELFFEDCVLVKYSSNDSKPLSLTTKEWKKIYNELYGGFEDLTENDDIDEAIEIENERKLLNNPNIKFTKEGYVKDGMVVDDDEIENEEYKPPIKKTKSKKTNIPEPIEIKKRVNKKSVESTLINESVELQELSETQKEEKKVNRKKRAKKETNNFVDNEMSTEQPIPPPPPPPSSPLDSNINLSLSSTPNTITEEKNTENNNELLPVPPSKTKNNSRVKKSNIEIPPLDLSSITDKTNKTETIILPEKKQKKPRTKKPVTNNAEINQETLDSQLISKPIEDENMNETKEQNSKNPKKTKNPKNPKNPKKTNNQNKPEKIVNESKEMHLSCINELTEEKYEEM